MTILCLVRSCVFQRVFELGVTAMEPQFIFIDEAGFNFTKRQRRRNTISQNAIIEVTGQEGTS